MGAKTGLLVYADGDVPDLLRRVQAAPADPERTLALMRRLCPGWEIAEGGASTLDDGVSRSRDPPGATARSSRVHTALEIRIAGTPG